MLRVDIQHAKPGMRLAQPVRLPNKPTQVLLKVDYELNETVLAKLGEIGVHWLWVRYPALDFVREHVDPQIMQTQGTLVEQVTRTLEAVQSQSSAKIDFAGYVKTIESLMDQVLGNPKAAVFLGDLAATDDDLIRHSSTVSYLSLLVGLKLESYIVKQRKHVDPSRAREVVNVGLGGMLHDVGLKMLDQDTLLRYRSSGDERDEAFRDHTRLGYELVRGQVDPSAATCVLNHHQRHDGSGYSGRGMPVLSDNRIHVFARIVALVDALDELRNPAGKEHARPTVWALHYLLRPNQMLRFDPSVLHAMLLVVPPYPPGSVVRLSDGRWCAVVDHRVTDPCRPLVQTIPDPKTLDENDKAGEAIDLAECKKDLFIAEHAGLDVTRLNFTLPQNMRFELTNTMYW
ncbi:MAG: HD domain-containing protein [Phycisphaera sp.]|nr:HD domain-containing protein [Phycisphaera sp.]